MGDDQTGKPGQTVSSERQAVWEQTREAVEKIADLDAGITETVIVFHVLGINTNSSCEGHAERGRGAPWVGIAAVPTADLVQLEARHRRVIHEIEKLDIKHPDRYDLAGQSVEIGHKIKRMHAKEIVKVVPYLEAFYAQRIVPFDRRLILSIFGEGWCMVMSQGAELQDTRSFDERRQKLAEYQQEMQDFTAYLKEQFFHP
jgi:hypothetical protein